LAARYPVLNPIFDRFELLEGVAFLRGNGVSVFSENV
jgi:hypothetical protein